MRAESTYTKLHKMCLWGLWNYSLQAAENTIIPILISQLKKLHRVGIYTASNLSYSDPLHAVGDCKKCSETAVGNVTQWIPAIFAVKRFAVKWQKLAMNEWYLIVKLLKDFRYELDIHQLFVFALSYDLVRI